MLQPRDPFELLGVSEDADEATIKTAYRGLAMVHHPDRDRSEGAMARFQGIKGAYEILMDPTRRAEALRLRRRDPLRFRSGGAPNTTPPPPMAAGEAKLAEGFGDFFANVDRNGRGREVRQTRAKVVSRDVERRISLTLQQAFKGGTFTIPESSGHCEACAGQGRVRSDKLHGCPACDGHGFTRVVRGMISAESECPTCRGRGTVPFKTCSACAGVGQSSTRMASVEIPPGCRDGYKVRLPGLGESGGSGQRAGDMIVTVEVRPDIRFVRSGEDLQTELSIPVWDAVLGAEWAISGIDGAQLKVVAPPGTRDGTRVAFKGQGMPAFSGRGDLEVVIRVDVPTTLSDEMRGKFLELKRLAEKTE